MRTLDHDTKSCPQHEAVQDRTLKMRFSSLTLRHPSTHTTRLGLPSSALRICILQLRLAKSRNLLRRFIFANHTFMDWLHPAQLPRIVRASLTRHVSVPPSLSATQHSHLPYPLRTEPPLPSPLHVVQTLTTEPRSGPQRLTTLCPIPSSLPNHARFLFLDWCVCVRVA